MRPGFHFVGGVLPELTAVRVSPGDAPDGAAGAGGGDPFVAGAALIDWGGGDGVEGGADEVAVGFGTGDKVDPGSGR